MLAEIKEDTGATALAIAEKLLDRQLKGQGR